MIRWDITAVQKWHNFIAHFVVVDKMHDENKEMIEDAHGAGNQSGSTRVEAEESID